MRMIRVLMYIYNFLCGVPLGNEGVFAKESGLKVIVYNVSLLVFLYVLYVCL